MRIGAHGTTQRREFWAVAEGSYFGTSQRGVILGRRRGKLFWAYCTTQKGEHGRYLEKGWLKAGAGSGERERGAGGGGGGGRRK